MKSPDRWLIGLFGVLAGIVTICLFLFVLRQGSQPSKVEVATFLPGPFAKATECTHLTHQLITQTQMEQEWQKQLQRAQISFTTATVGGLTEPVECYQTAPDGSTKIVSTQNGTYALEFAVSIPVQDDFSLDQAGNRALDILKAFESVDSALVPLPLDSIVLRIAFKGSDTLVLDFAPSIAAKFRDKGLRGKEFFDAVKIK